MRRLRLLLPLLALLGGCASPTLTPADRQAAQHPTRAISAAQAHRRQGDWAAAVKILREAASHYPDNPRIAQALANLEAAWRREKQALRDRLLLQEASALRQQQPLLEQLTRLDPEDLPARTSLLALRLGLKARLTGLDQCAAHHEQNLPLRRSCAQLALRIAPDARRKKTFESLDQDYQLQVQHWRTRLAVAEAQKQARHRRALLGRARRLINAGSYREARPLLEEVLAEDPDNRAATGLMIQLQTGLGAQIKALLQLGDSLYREGKLNAAITAWRTVLTLAPGQPEAKAKVGRARHVLEKLNRLRQQQRRAGSE